VARSEAPDLSEYGTVAAVDLAKSAEDSFDSRPISTFISITSKPTSPSTPGSSTYGPTSPRPRRSSRSTSKFDQSPTEAVATALLYGIRAETLDFKRDTTPADLTAAAYLHPFANHDTLEQVESPSMSPETLDVLAEAIQNREVQGSHLFSTAGFIRDREALAQAAQHLLNLEGITTTAVLGNR